MEITRSRAIKEGVKRTREENDKFRAPPRSLSPNLDLKLNVSNLQLSFCDESFGIKRCCSKSEPHRLLLLSATQQTLSSTYGFSLFHIIIFTKLFLSNLHVRLLCIFIIIAPVVIIGLSSYIIFLLVFSS